MLGENYKNSDQFDLIIEKYLINVLVIINCIIESHKYFKVKKS